MTDERARPIDVRTQAALTELEGLIKQHYPDATFQVMRGEDDPDAVHLATTVDLDDPDEVLDLVIARVMELQVEEGLPIFVIPTRPRHRMLAMRRASARARQQERFPSPPLSP